jgi:hypothetical protein
LELEAFFLVVWDKDKWVRAVVTVCNHGNEALLPLFHNHGGVGKFV